MVLAGQLPVADGQRRILQGLKTSIALCRKVPTTLCRAWQVRRAGSRIEKGLRPIIPLPRLHLGGGLPATLARQPSQGLRSPVLERVALGGGGLQHVLGDRPLSIPTGRRAHQRFGVPKRPRNGGRSSGTGQITMIFSLRMPPRLGGMVTLGYLAICPDLRASAGVVSLSPPSPIPATS